VISIIAEILNEHLLLLEHRIKEICPQFRLQFRPIRLRFML